MSDVKDLELVKRLRKLLDNKRSGFFLPMQKSYTVTFSNVHDADEFGHLLREIKYPNGQPMALTRPKPELKIVK